MCGLSGLVQETPDERLRSVFIKASSHYLKRRGPDHFSSVSVTPELLFSHARLSIIDLVSGDQPISDAEGALIFNGEIYNYKEKRHPDIVYQTTSDSEVLLKGLHRKGIAFLNEADGMFAFAYYNRQQRELVLARDRFGIKPLYYYFDGRTLAFASRLQPLMLFSAKQVDKVAMAEYYAYRACRAPRTIFTDIHEIRAGHALRFSLEKFQVIEEKSWVEPLQVKRNLDNEAAAIEALENAMNLSIDRHLISDVPVATFLSGGVDSSLITALAAKKNPDIEALSIGFKDKRYDESQYASAVARQYRLRHHIRYCDHTDFIRYLDSWPSIMDDVVADPSAVLLAVLSNFAHEMGFKVVLSGEGADEIFAGYNQYHRFLLSRRFAAYGQYAPRLLQKLTDKLKPGQSRYAQFVRHATDDPYFYGTGRIFEPYLLGGVIDTRGMEIRKADSLAAALALDLQSRLPDDILTRTDRATMHASIEARVPFLTEYVWRVSASLDESLLIKGKTQKYLLKKMAEAHVPHECLYRPKVGFDLPLAKWLRGPLRSYVMDHLQATWQGDYLHEGAMAGVIDAHMSAANDNADKIWAFLLLENNVRILRAISVASVEAGDWLADEGHLVSPSCLPAGFDEPAVFAA